MANAELAIELLTAQGVDQRLAMRLANYAAFLLEWNARCNLTGAKTIDALLPHLLDALTLKDDIDGSLIDIGSGGGLPAIPLALATGVPIIMVESIAKKCTFLREAMQFLGLEGTVLQGRAEAFALQEEHRERYHCATARAVAQAPTVLEYLMPFLKIGGQALLQRGQYEDAERRSTSDAALVLGGQVIEERMLEGQRRIVRVAKQRPTPWRFPRKQGMAYKKAALYIEAIPKNEVRV